MPCWTVTDYEALWQLLYIIPKNSGCPPDRCLATLFGQHAVATYGGEGLPSPRTKGYGFCVFGLTWGLVG